jgi:hypothetical protein
MKNYNVYFAVGLINIFAQEKGFEYQVVCSIHDDIRNVFLSCQNDNPEFRMFNQRSMCVGDVIEDDETGECFMVVGRGLKRVSPHIVENVGFHLLIKN